MTSLRTLIFFSLSPILLVACGGVTSPGSKGNELEQDGGFGGDGTGGGGGGEAGSGTAGSGTGGELACCLAAAVCDPGDKQISGPDECPVGADCYENAICCSSVWCVRQTANCEAYPACDPEDREITGACPPASSCYTRSLCGTTITCLQAAIDGGPGPDSEGGSCDPATEYYRNYIGSSPAECAVIDYACPVNTTYFGNECGCGCEQDATCPEWADCMPGPGIPNPYCTAEGEARCPYTKRAY